VTTVYFPVQLVITGIITVGLAIATGGASIAAELEVARHSENPSVNS